MAIKNYQKPKYVPENTLLATDSGWCYTPNHNEVLVAVGQLPDKLLAAGLASDGTGATPVNTVLPMITGTVEVDGVLYVSTGTWTGTAPITYTYVWETSDDEITWSALGNTTNSYTIIAGNEALKYRVNVTATNAVTGVTVTTAVILAV